MNMLNYDTIEVILSHVNDYKVLVNLTEISKLFHDMIHSSFSIWKHTKVKYIDDIHHYNFANYPVQILDCSKTRMLGDELRYTPHLHTLDCRATSITGSGLKYTPKLRELHCAITKITDQCLLNMPLLEKLQCSYTAITDECIKQIPLLRTLYSISSRLTDEDLKSMPLLQTFNGAPV
jgi:hypothetical protein